MASGEFFLMAAARPGPAQPGPDRPGSSLRAPKCIVSLCLCSFLAPNTPKKNPARFARRIASFPYVLLLLAPNTSFFAARFARRSASFPIVWGSP